MRHARSLSLTLVTLATCDVNAQKLAQHHTLLQNMG